MKLHKYTAKQLRDAAQNSTSLRQVLIKLNVAPYGGNYAVLKKAIGHYQLDVSHFAGQAWNKGNRLPSRQPIKAYLSNLVPIQSYKLKNRLLKEGILEPKCMNCHRTKWNDQPIPLELDHIDGDNKNNRFKTCGYCAPIAMH